MNITPEHQEVDQSQIPTKPRANELSIPLTGARVKPEQSLRETQRLDKIMLEETETGLEATQHMSYFRRQYLAREFMQLLSPVDQQKINEALAARGLEDIGFTIYARSNETITPERLKQMTVYLLLHGWTATEDISSHVRTPDGYSVVERILRKDPQGIIITIDSGGSGRSRFTNAVLNNKKELRQRLTVDEYVEQIHTLMVDILGITEPSKIRIKGHSRGGAAAIRYAMKYGCGKAEADAPAFLLARPWRRLIGKELRKKGRQQELDELIRSIWRNYPTSEKGTVVGVPLTAQTLYDALGISTGVGALVADIGPGWERIGTEVTSFLFVNLLQKDLLGQIVFPGHWGVAHRDVLSENERMWSELDVIHQGQIRETREEPKRQLINSLSISNLARGQMLGHTRASLENLDMRELQRLERVKILAATKDTLATLPQMKKAIAGLAVLALLKYEQIKNASENPDQTQLREAAFGYIAAANVLNQIKEIEGGHYATYFYPEFEELLVPLGK